MNPQSYPRRILLCVSGLSPQIVTETLYALTVIGEPRFVPTEIHLLTTAEGAEWARLTLLSDDPGWFQRLRQDYGLPAIRFTLDTLHILRTAEGRLLIASHHDLQTVTGNFDDVLLIRRHQIAFGPVSEAFIPATIAQAYDSQDQASSN